MAAGATLEASKQASKQGGKQAGKQAKRSSALFSCQAENRTKTEGVFCPFPYGWDAPFLCVAGQ